MSLERDRKQRTLSRAIVVFLSLLAFELGLDRKIISQLCESTRKDFKVL